MNVSFLLLLNKEWKEEEQSDLDSIGTCDLHILHNSFNISENAAEFKPKKSLSLIFHDIPTWPSDYTVLSAAVVSDYPLKLSGHCWVENENLARRARETWPKVAQS